MTAAELPVNAQFKLPGDDTLYTVTHQVPGRRPHAHLTHVQYFDVWSEHERTAAWAGHTEVIRQPPTQATDSTPLAQCDP